MERPLVPGGLPPPESGAQTQEWAWQAPGQASWVQGSQRCGDWHPLQTCTRGEKHSNKGVWCYSLGPLWL